MYVHSCMHTTVILWFILYVYTIPTFAKQIKRIQGWATSKYEKIIIIIKYGMTERLGNYVNTYMIFNMIINIAQISG